ncbi:MAG: hypothetical protein RLZZ515_2430, partial [Cyanobacteriota bacterium]
MPWIWICKAGRKWIIELDPIEGGDHPRYLTPIGAAVANHIAALGERVFNSVDALTHEGGYFAENTRDILFESMPTSYLQFKAPSLAIACTVLYTNLVVILLWVEHSAGKLKFDRLVFFTVPVMAGAMFLFFISRTINRYVEEGESVQVYAPLRFWGRSWEVQTLLGFIFCYFYFDDFN